MLTFFFGTSLLLITGIGAYTAFSAITQKDEHWGFRLVELIFALLSFFVALGMSSFFHR
jgi:hypothetical protein